MHRCDTRRLPHVVDVITRHPHTHPTRLHHVYTTLPRPTTASKYQKHVDNHDNNHPLDAHHPPHPRTHTPDVTHAPRHPPHPHVAHVNTRHPHVIHNRHFSTHPPPPVNPTLPHTPNCARRCRKSGHPTTQRGRPYRPPHSQKPTKPTCNALWGKDYSRAAW